MPKTYDGGCHCGRVRFRVTAELEGVTDCNCSICTKKGFLHLIVPPEQFELVSGADALAEYRFNTGTARHMFCRFCGIQPFYVPRSDPDKIDVNLRCLEGIDLAAIETQPFDGRNWEQAIEQPVPWR
ncbi:MAG TPA: GFA family protein [Stellaceae bacterium]|nr:GFA family protein [Stellaceae bacterium]